MGAARAQKFLRPLTLVMPHCFDVRSGEESIAMLAGAPHGAASWEPVVASGADDPDAMQLNGQEMQVRIPFAEHVRSVRQAERLRRRLCRPLSRLRHVGALALKAVQAARPPVPRAAQSNRGDAAGG